MPRFSVYRALLLVALCLPLTGCATGYGNYGPGGLRDRIGSRSSTSYHRDSQNRLIRTTSTWEEGSTWRGAWVFGVSMGPNDASMTGLRDTTYERAKYYHSDLLFNVARDRASIGVTAGYLSSHFEGSPAPLHYSGITFGPMGFLRLAPYVSVSGSAARVFGSVKDEEGYYFTPAFGFIEKEALSGWRTELTLNVIPVRTERFDLGVRVGYQQTQSEEKPVFAAARKYKSTGVVAELIGLVF